MNNFNLRSLLLFDAAGTGLRFSFQINVITLHTTYSSCKMLQNNTFFMLLSSRYTFIISPHHPHSDNCTLPFLHIDAFCQDLVQRQLSFHFYFKSYKVLYLSLIKDFNFLKLVCNKIKGQSYQTTLVSEIFTNIW